MPSPLTPRPHPSQLKPYVSGKHFPQGKRVPDYASMVAGAQPAAGGQAGGKDELR